MLFSLFSLATFMLLTIPANGEQFPFTLQHLRHLQQTPEDLKQTRELQLLLSNAINDAVSSSSSFSLFSHSPYLPGLPALPNVTLPCKNALLMLFLAPSKRMDLAQMVDATGKPASGILQGATSWMGNFDQCLGLGMNHCSTIFNTSFVQGTPLAPLCAPSPSGGPSWGVCVPHECGITDAVELANFVLQQITPMVADKVPQLDFIRNISMLPGRCQSADDPAPALSGGIIFFLVVIAIIGTFTVLGTAYDYFIQCEGDKNFDFKRMPSDVVVNVVDEDGNVKSGEGNGVVNGGFVNGEVGTAQVNGEVINGGGGGGGGEVVVTTQVKVKVKQKITMIKFLLCFSMLTNGKKILSFAPANDNVGCINGIRFLSLTWVILGHSYAFYIYFMNNPVYIFSDIISRVTIQPIINGTFSVDTFFVLSGLLTAYLFFKRNGDKKESLPQKLKTVFSMYVHRYLRLTPALGILMGFAMFIPLYMSSGPRASSPEALKGTCDTYWWYNILYINNFKPEAGACVGHVWYLANDMQFFLLSPIILYAYKFREIAGHIVASIFWLACIGANLGITLSGTYGILVLDLGGAGFQDIYIKPWTRIGPYIIGIVAGYLLYKYRKEELRPSWVTAIIWWVISAVLALSVVYGLTNYYKEGVLMKSPPSKSADVFYITFSRSAWGVAVSWLVIACATGRAGPINTLLSWTAFGPVSRMNYSAYLYHILVMTTISESMKSLMSYSDALMVTLYLGTILLSYGVAFLTTICFESPFIGLEKLIF